MSEARPVILIVEDDLDVADMLNAYFNVQGYDVQSVHWGEDAVRECVANPPKLVVLDIRLPDIDGFEVARRLRRNRRTAMIPIIFLTEKRGRTDRLQGLELGADDYITKPFDVQELRLRVRNALKRAVQGAITNPVTNLPEGKVVDEQLSHCLTTSDWGLLLVSLKNLEIFRELYGFVASDDVLRAISFMISNAVREIGQEDDFISQFGATEFLVITRSTTLPALVERLQSRLEQSLDYFYPLKDRGRTDFQDKRLRVQIKHVEPEEGSFKTLDALKKFLAT